MTHAHPRLVILEAPGEGAYRVTVIGSRPGMVTRLLSVAGEPIRLALAPGSYNAVIESVSTSGITSCPFMVTAAGKGDPAVFVSLGGNPDLDPSAEIRSLPRPRYVPESEVEDSAVSAAIEGMPATRTKPISTGNLDYISGSRRATGVLSLSDHATRRSSYLPPSGSELTLPSNLAEAARRTFRVGLSVNDESARTPTSAGRWRASPAHIEPAENSGTELRFKLFKPEGNQPGTMQRLTVAVEGRMAWRIGVPECPDGVWLMLRPTTESHDPDVVTTMRPVNERTATLIGSLQRALPGEVDELLIALAKPLVQGSPDQSRTGPTAALATLMAFDGDPWASIAAALLLVRTGQIGDAIDLALQLDDRYRWIPDAAVAAAWAAVAGPDGGTEEASNRCLGLLVSARKRGAPYLCASNALALQMLTALATSGSINIRLRSMKERKQWSERSRKAVQIGAFFGWELDADSMANLNLQPDTDNVIVEGHVTARALQARLRASPAEPSVA